MKQAELTLGQVATRAGINSSAVRYYGGETIRRLQVIDIAKRAGFGLEEIGLLLNDSSAETQLRTLAERKLPEVEALIARAEAMRDWLLKARHCHCSSLELCALFAGGKAT